MPKRNKCYGNIFWYLFYFAIELQNTFSVRRKKWPFSLYSHLVNMRPLLYHSQLRWTDILFLEVIVTKEKNPDVGIRIVFMGAHLSVNAFWATVFTKEKSLNRFYKLLSNLNLISNLTMIYKYLLISNWLCFLILIKFILYLF